MVPRLGADPGDHRHGGRVVETIARTDGDRVREVTLRWTPSFVVLAGQSVESSRSARFRSTWRRRRQRLRDRRGAEGGVAVRRELAKRLAQRGMAIREA